MKFRSIQAKIIILIIIVLVVFTAAIIWISVNNQRSSLLHEADRTLFTIADLLYNTIKNLMLKGDAPIAVSAMGDYKTIPELDEVEIYRTDGNVAFFDYKTLNYVNAHQNKYQFQKTVRVKEKMFDNPNFQYVLSNEWVFKHELKDTREMEYFLPIRNVFECWQCHGQAKDTGSLRGVAHLKISLKPTYQSIQSSFNMLTLTLVVSALIVILLLILTLRKILIRPLLTIGQKVTAFGEGQLDTKVEIKSRDELGDLSDKINEMFVGVKERISLSRYVSRSTDQMIRQQNTSGDDGVEKKDITILFSDIRGFTTYSEAHPPDEVIANLNAILQVQADIVERHGGDIDKFIGDALMAVFDDEHSALKAAFEMIVSVKTLNKKSDAGLFIGVGINTGEVIAGNIGSSNRLEYAVIGDTVNVASRLCGIAKPSMLLISESTYLKVQDSVEAKLIANQKIKGKTNTINFYVVVKVR